MWNKEDMDHYSAQLELQETLVLCAIYDEGMVDIKRVVSFVMNHTKEYDVNYIHNLSLIYYLTTTVQFNWTS